MSRVLIIFCILISICSNPAYAQQNQDLGTIKGIVRDTAHNYVLQSATISVYRAGKLDSNLISYQITNTYGEFIFTKLPTGIPLRIQVSNVGYSSLNKYVTISPDTKFLNLNTLILTEKNNTLKEVVIEVPPIIMNGDTLEFNASAFKLDTNAVVEDLLRKIPNVTLWGDGKITVNGREVKSLLVNGKQFFGGDFKIATQNIAKNAIEKIQVYQTVTSQSNPLDSTIEMNLKLKRDKKFGYFGKIGIGYGSNDRYELDASINFFNEKMQFVLVGAFNNTNKLATDVSSITGSSTFKGIGANIDYAPDFSRSGMTKSKSLGANFTYNFIDKPTSYHKSLLNLDYFVTSSDNDNSSKLETTTTTSINNKLFESSINKSLSDTLHHRFDTEYEWIKNNHSLSIKQTGVVNRDKINSELFRTSFDDQNVVTSTNNTVNSRQTNTNIYDLAVKYDLGANTRNSPRKFKGLSSTYLLTISNENESRLTQTEFKSLITPTLDRAFDRKYDTKSQYINQQLDLELIKIKSLIFGQMKLLGIDFTLNNRLILNNKNNDQQVDDYNPLNSSYERNTYLTNNVKSQVIEESPSFSLVKLNNYSLSNRYTKTWTFKLTAKQKFLYFNNQSDKSFQNITRSYSRFTPEASIEYSANQYSEYYRHLLLKYSTLIKIPELEQLAPLVDSTNFYDLRVGNLRLKESRTRLISLSLLHEDLTSKNTLNYGLDLNFGFIDNNIIDSTIISDDNTRTTYFTNSDGNRYINVQGSIRKAIKLKTSELQIKLTNNTVVFKSSAFINSIFTFLNNSSNRTKITLNYTYKDDLAVEAIQTYLTYTSKQAAFNTKYSGANMATTLSSSYNLNKGLTLSSNITFNRSTSANTNPTNFVIWNASGTYRLLKGNNLEFKLAALDILHQNTSIVNYGSPNSFTIGTQNVLQNYFMATISYYPRQFGKKTNKK